MKASCICIVLLTGICAIVKAVPHESQPLFFEPEKSSHKESTSDSKFNFKIDDQANFNFTVGGKVFLQSAPAFVYTDAQRFSADNGTLILDHLETQGGADKISKWKSQCFVYKYKAGSMFWRLCVKRWHDPDLPLVVFQQQFINGTNDTARTTDRVISGFPSFQVPTTDAAGLSYVSYQGSMFGGTRIVIQRWNAGGVLISGGIEGGPVAVFDQNNGVCTMAPFSQFMSSSRDLDEFERINWGVMGGVPSIPKGFNLQTIVYCGTTGINGVFSEWGDFMRTYYNKADIYRKNDFTLRYLGYWTDAGAYYYYMTEKNKTYEQTILDVKNYTDSVNIPYRYVQYDSWFYPKGPHGGVLTWNATAEIAPDGFPYLFNKLQWPVGAHNRYWSAKTPYAKVNGGPYDFIVETEKAIPQDLDFWMFLMKESQTWGLVMYEQDWLDVEFAGMNATLTTLDVAERWLLQMGQAARATGLTIQYCMSNPRHGMQSLRIPVVTQARVSGDYRAGSDQWQIGEISIFADAMGIAPFKDTFWTTRVQPGNKYNLEEPNAELQAAVSTLSTGPVGPSDMIGRTNVSMLMQCCRADGLILKPDKPATAIDKQFWEKAWNSGVGPKGEVWTTYTRIGHDWYFGIILAAALDASFNITPANAGFEFFNPTTLITRSAHSVTPMLYSFSEDNPFELTSLCTRQNFCMYYTSPVFTIGSAGTKVALYGEEYKFVPMSRDRVSDIDVTTEDVVLTLRGVSGESTIFSNFVNGMIVRHSCTFGPTGTAKLSLGGLHSSCITV